MTVHPVATSTSGAEASSFLGMVLADRGDRRRAACVAVVLLLAFAATAPFAGRALPAVPTFVPADRKSVV